MGVPIGELFDSVRIESGSREGTGVRPRDWLFLGYSDDTQVATTGQRANHREIIRHELFRETGLSHIAEAERTEAAAEGGLEDVLVGIVVKVT